MQPDAGANFSTTDNDYTPEELELVQKAQADNEERKRLLYEKQVQEEQEK